MKNLLWIFSFFVAFVLNSCTNTTLETSQWRGPDRDGIYPDKGLLKEWPENGPELAWKFDQLGKGYSSPAFTSDRFYITGMTDSTGSIFCFDHSGNLQWKKEYGLEWTRNFPGSRANVTVVGNLGYIMSSRGMLHCFNAGNGEFIWSVDLIKDYGAQQILFGLTEVLAVDGDKLFCTPGGEEHNVIALNRHNGELIWSSEGNKKPSVYGTPTIFTHAGKRYLSVNTKENIMALDIENGSVAWMHPMQYPHGIHANSTIYRDGHMFVLDGWEAGSFMLKISEEGNSVEQLWKNDLMDLENGDAILLGDKLYGTNWKEKGISCVDWKTGKELFTNKDFLSGTLIFADGLFYFYGVKGMVALIKATDDAFEVISLFQLEGKKSRDHSAHPVIYDKKLYIRYDTKLYAFDIAV